MEESSEKSPLNKLNSEENKFSLSLDRYRWVIVSIFSAYCSSNFFLVFQFTIIADITERYYNVSSTLADISGLIFMIVYIILFIPVGKFMDKHDLRTISLISTGLTLFGNLLKFFAVNPDNFYMIIISQGICGIAQVFMMGLPPKVATVWFGAEEVSMACGMGVMGCQLGMAIGSSFPTFFVPDSTNMQEIKNGYIRLFVLDNLTSMIIFIIVLLFFRSEPEFPPSLSQVAARNEQKNPELDKEILKKCLTNTDFLLVLYCFGTAWGLWNSIGIILNQMFLHYFPTVGNILGILEMSTILAGGVFGSLIFGCVLDKTHEFKKLSVFLLLMNCISWLIFIFFVQERYLIGACISFLVGGFFGGSLAVTAFEYCTEVIYPLPEAFGTTVLSASIYFFSIIYTLSIEYVFSNIGYFIGQMMIALSFGTAAFGCLFISSNFKRRDANLPDLHLESYGALGD